MGSACFTTFLLGFLVLCCGRKLNIMGYLILVSVLVLAVCAFAENSSENDLYVNGNSSNFITWDDMKVDELRVSVRSGDDYNRTRVIVVDKNGGGDSVTVQGAINMVAEYNTQRVKIFILPGIYREKVIVPKTKPYISLIGNETEASNTMITWNNKASDKDGNGCELGTYKSATVTIESDYFCAFGITFENSVVAVPGGRGWQAVALRISGDKAMFYKVRVLGTQDTLLDELGTHYFFRSYIQGSVDFIFGKGRSRYQECVLHSTANRSGAIAAHHRNSPDDTGFSFVNCTINGTGKIYLGRPWGNYSRAIYSYCYFDDIITPPGWTDWNHPERQKTSVFGEYQCWGRGAETKDRVAWSKQFNYHQVRPYLDMKFINGEEWLRL
ncbi:hypothetical protein SLEP1_g29683 [Rubroshorea leprosula]|uniref:Pectinesterase n=1 Tax=Rubroshorea leprosula TaxID=152421 RepID=A0AAV5K083_9ROSI|nr:hypothetical protein SLEP1_g29683 [Rubroshorea leprosula]